MGMHSYPISGMGICMGKLEWKDPDMPEQIIENGGEFYFEKQPNGIVACLDFVILDGAYSANGDDDKFLIVYDHRAYHKTPFDSIEELKDFFVRALLGHVNNTEEEIRGMVENVMGTHYG